MLIFVSSLWQLHSPLSPIAPRIEPYQSFESLFLSTLGGHVFCVSPIQCTTHVQLSAAHMLHFKAHAATRDNL